MHPCAQSRPHRGPSVCSSGLQGGKEGENGQLTSLYIFLFHFTNWVPIKCMVIWRPGGKNMAGK